MNALHKLARVLLRLLSILGSLALGVAIMILLAIAMGWATFLEREMGTPVAQYLVYASRWFYALIGALALNISCAALVRLPKLFARREDANGRKRWRFNSKLLPFFFAHLGTIALILGCWITAKYSVKARAVIPEGTAVETAIDVDAHVFNLELEDFDAPQAEPQTIRANFAGGPLNWRDQTSATLWRANVAEPILAQKPEKNVFHRLAKRASAWSQRAAFYAAKCANSGRKSIIYDADGLKLEILEYATLADYAPVPNLKLNLTQRDENGDERALDAELEFPFDAMAIGADPLATSRRSQRKVLDSGIRIVYMLADSAAEANAFAMLAPQPGEPGDLLTLALDGARYAVPIEKLAPLARYGDPTVQIANYRAQSQEIERRLRQERERENVKHDDKPLQTIDRETLVAKNQELRELSSKLAKLAEDAKNEQEIQKLSQEFLQKRTLNYLATTWAQLESSTPTSEEFCKTLEKMNEQNEERIRELEELEKNVTLGEKGWKIVAFETTPTLLQGVEELQGWTARIILQSPQGTREEATLQSELPERNRYPESGRVFGAIWLAEPSGDDNEFGRAWSKSLASAKLELMQTRDGKVLYRYNDGGNVVQSGALELNSQDAVKETFASTPVAFNPSARAGVQITQFAVQELAFQDELGARLMPTLFQKELANEFYGKVKLRATLDDVSETFWLRAIPLESVSDEQRQALTKRIASSKRRLTISLTDAQVELGAALFVKRFTPTYEPGSSTPASFESVVRILPKGLSQEEQEQAIANNEKDDLAIRMNRPGSIATPETGKVYWAYQDSYRGPFKPGDPEFDAVTKGALLPGETEPRAILYHTIISFNNDPGRGVKYLACLFIVLGTAMLVYRRTGKSQKSTSELPNTSSQDGSVDSDKTPKPSASVTSIVVLLFATLLSLFSSATARADEIVPEEVFARTSAPDQIDWTPWRLLPVFDGGRVQPLNTFAEIVVRDITGSAKPIIKLPQETLQRLEGDKPVNFPTLEDFLADVAQTTPQDAEKSNREEQERWYNEVARQAVEQQREVAKRLRATFPNGERKFNAAELLFSWLAEPEMWEYLPFLDDPKSEVARNALKLNAEAIAARAGRIAPADCDALAPGSNQTLVALFRTETARASQEALKALDKLEDKIATFRSLTFAPTQGASSQPQTYFNKILYGSTSPHPGGASSTSPMRKLDLASERLEAALAREKSSLRKESPFNDKEFLLRRRIAIEGDAQGRETLELARSIALLAGLYRRYPLATTDLLFQKALDSIGAALKTLRTHRDEIIAQEKFSLEYRQELMKVVSALEEISDQLEAAYLALVTEAPKSLAVAPTARERVFRSTESQDSPWLSLQTILWAPDAAYARFVDPIKSDTGRETLDGGQTKSSPFDSITDALEKTIDSSAVARESARAFLDAARAYRDRDVQDRAQRVSKALERFAAELRALAERVEPEREKLAAQVESDEAKRAVILSKTAYPARGELNAELFYYQLNAFFWNWIACLCAVVALLVSYARQILWRARDGKSENPRREKLFFAIGLGFLAASCAVAFLGGAIRAYITGWAPVANMFETVVLLAFLIAAIAIGYTLAPLWTRPFGAAWRATAFSYARRRRQGRGAALALLTLRVALTLTVAWFGVKFWASSQSVDASLWDSFKRTLASSLAMQGILDSCAAFATFLFVALLAPRFLVALIALVFCPNLRRDGEISAHDERDDVFSRKGFLAASAVVATLVAAAAYFNSVEFNPHIRPLVAVLRSNFWLTIHVIAIIVSYALGAIAWVVSLTSLAAYIFGRYDQLRETDPTPSYSLRVAPFIIAMTRSSALFLTVGIILGARWADFSWGRFWSWDPKEVWALVTLFVYLVVLHVYKMSGNKRFFLPLGATFGALAIIMTWYGLSFVMGGGGRHAYASGESNKVAALYVLFAVNIAWAALATIRYAVQRKIARKAQ